MPVSPKCPLSSTTMVRLAGAGADDAERADAHELLAVAGDDHHGLVGLSERKAETERDGRAHGAPQVEVASRSPAANTS